ncbi:MAG: hypothetical protein ACYCPP_09385, partial [Nitrososphaerales archaeon]
MSGFNLSPGITPFIADIAILGLVLSFGLAAFLSRRSGLRPALLVLGIDSVLVSVFKLYTDYADFWDALLAMIILIEALFVIQLGSRKSKLQSGLTRKLALVFGILGLVLSADKILSDFYDPFDLLLSCQ